MSDDFAVVTSDIPFGAVYAYRKGDKIRTAAVEQNGWGDYVAAPDSKEAREAQGLPADEPAPAEQPKTAPTTPPSSSTAAPAGGKDK
jgi:hypothetical protein